MRWFRLLGFAYVAVVALNFLGCEAPHHHHTDVMSETVVEQQEVVE